jgi:hypothetical protein
MGKERVPIWKARKSFVVPVARIVLPVVLILVLFLLSRHYVPGMPLVAKTLVGFYSLLPGITSYLFATAGFALMFMPDDLKKLERHRTARLIIAAVLMLLGLGAVLSESVQKSEEATAANAERMTATFAVACSSY